MPKDSSLLLNRNLSCYLKKLYLYLTKSFGKNFEYSAQPVGLENRTISLGELPS